MVFLNLGKPNNELRARWDDGVRFGAPIRCTVDPGHARPTRRVMDLSVVVPSPELPDFVWTPFGECLIQENVLSVLTAAGFSGFSASPTPVRCEETWRGVPPRLWELRLSGWGGIVPARSGIRPRVLCHNCGLVRYTPFTDPNSLIGIDQWDGTDFFMVWPLPQYMFITSRVAKVLHDHRFSGLSLTLSADLSCSNDSLAPGRASDWLPPDRARYVREALGIDDEPSPGGLRGAT